MANLTEIKNYFKSLNDATRTLTGRTDMFPPSEVPSILSSIQVGDQPTLNIQASYEEPVDTTKPWIKLMSDMHSVTKYSVGNNFVDMDTFNWNPIPNSIKSAAIAKGSDNYYYIFGGYYDGTPSTTIRRFSINYSGISPNVSSIDDIGVMVEYSSIYGCAIPYLDYIYILAAKSPDSTDFHTKIRRFNILTQSMETLEGTFPDFSSEQTRFTVNENYAFIILDCSTLVIFDLESGQIEDQINLDESEIGYPLAQSGCPAAMAYYYDKLYFFGLIGGVSRIFCLDSPIHNPSGRLITLFDEPNDPMFNMGLDIYNSYGIKLGNKVILMSNYSISPSGQSYVFDLESETLSYVSGYPSMYSNYITVFEADGKLGFLEGDYKYINILQNKTVLKGGEIFIKTTSDSYSPMKFNHNIFVSPNININVDIERIFFCEEDGMDATHLELMTYNKNSASWENPFNTTS